MKSNKIQYWTNTKTGQIVDKQPLGLKGLEGIDWDWREIGEDYLESDTKINIEEAEKLSSPRGRVYRKKKRKKVSNWRSHKYWFEQQFEDIDIESIKRELRGNRDNKYSNDKMLPEGVHANTMSQPREYKGYDNLEEIYQNRQGRNKRCVWNIPTRGIREAHFAVYPEKLIEIPVKAGCPEFICKQCGKARVKIFDDERINTRPGKNTGTAKSGKDIDPNKELHNSDLSKYRQQIVNIFKGYTNCGCKNPTYRPGVVLDLFAGRGTTGIVAQKLGRSYILIELSEKYVKMCKKNLAQGWLL